MELAWNTQKNKLSDVKGKEMEQERKGKIKNKEIDLERTKNNYDLVQSEKNLYQRVKTRVDDLKQSGSRVQKNSVVMYSNIFTVPEETAKLWGEEKTDEYFKTCYEFFCYEFGKENVVSAKIHKDETTPHMHLHFVPVNKKNGKLQARVSMNKEKINFIHDVLPKFLQHKGFDVVRGSGKTRDNNIEDVHEYKEVKKQIEAQKTQFKRVLEANEMYIDNFNKTIEKLSVEKKTLEKEILTKKSELDFQNQNVKFNKNIKDLTKNVKQEKNVLGKKTGNYILPEDDYKKIYGYAKRAFEKNQENKFLRNEFSVFENENLKLKSENEKMKMKLDKEQKEKNELQKKLNRYENFLREKNLFEVFDRWLMEQKKKIMQLRNKNKKDMIR